MKPHLLVLQASSLCNLDCSYCYVPNRQDRATMPEATLRAALRLVFSACDPGDSIRILWHAGEPLAAGLAFYQRAAEIIRECNTRGLKTSQAMQTNGTLIDQAWCQFFKSEKIQVGLSVDGPAAIHDLHRRSLGNQPTHAHVMRGAELLRQHGLPLYAIAVLSPESLEFADEIFDFFLQWKFQWVGFNLQETEGRHASAFADSKPSLERHRQRYSMFMSRLFGRWHEAGRRPRIREFERMSAAMGRFLMDQSFYRRADELIPFRNVVVTRTGEISTFSPELASGTPADPLRFSLGNVHSAGSLKEVAASVKFRTLSTQIQSGVERCRRECEYFPICGAGVTSNKFYENGTFDCTQTTTCALHVKSLADVVAEGLRGLPR